MVCIRSSDSEPSDFSSSLVTRKLPTFARTTHFSMYADLWTNAPKESDLEVPNFPWKKTLPSYVTADEVREYLTDYIQHFNVARHYETYSNVKSVKFEKSSNTFKVTIENVKIGDGRVVFWQNYSNIIFLKSRLFRPNLA